MKTQETSLNSRLQGTGEPVTIQELRRILGKFPRYGVVAINRNMLMVKVGKLRGRGLFFVDEPAPSQETVAAIAQQEADEMGAGDEP